ncbi:uncharacterized protein LOC143630208 [Bidens hawaiensis]|uniref:uncharacterized protein LOC143630208 n=1 Tax=Bidens hawaiensis TaxID=980011 RepID=UPI004049922F
MHPGSDKMYHNMKEEYWWIGSEIVQRTTDQVMQIRERLKAARDRQKIYADIRCKPLKFKEGDRLLINWNYQEMKGIHDVFHVSNLPKYLADETLAMPLKDIKVDEKLKFVEQPIQIEDSRIKFLKRKRLNLVKVKWDSR